MFDNLARRLQNALGKLTNKGKLSEKDVDLAMREIRLALLEADVQYKVVKDFVKETKERCIGEEVMKSLTPGQMVIKIVREQLTALMSDPNQKLTFASTSPTVIMLCGLQGAGKTTHVGKLAKWLIRKGKRPMLAAGDVYRPAAVKQLQVVGKQAQANVFSMGTDVDPVEIAKAAYAEAKRTGHDVLLIDTAGRLQIDTALMEELKRIKSAVPVQETLLVIDAMTGQEAVHVAETFNEAIELTGVLLTKLDGDARGGAALSVRAVTKKPIKFLGVGEKLEDLEEFHPDRLVGRILGMGDVLSLIERAEQAFDAEQAREMERKIRSSKYDLNDFYDQLQQMKNMGPLDDLLKMLPGVGSRLPAGFQADEKQLLRIEAVLTSMTDEERRNPDLINGSRRERIAKGAGQSPVVVNRLLKQFKETKKLMKQMGGLQKKAKKGRFKNPFF
uniref:signal recognition particle protein n=1 Tax=Ndongobacter massiliensis TaxID=1871025 RepID=UPI000930CF1B|nr:signal recognition particle protein [Ndongobacter massiliensis]